MFRGFKGAPPKSNSAKASMLHSWQPALHRPDVIAILRPWNWSVLAPWQLRNPLALWLCVRISKNNMFFWLPKQTAFPPTLVSFCLIDLLGPVQEQWLSCTLTERDLTVSHLLPNTRCQMPKYVRCARSLYNFENWKCKYYPQPLNLSMLSIYNSYWVKLLAILFGVYLFYRAMSISSSLLVMKVYSSTVFPLVKHL